MDYERLAEEEAQAQAEVAAAKQKVLQKRAAKDAIALTVAAVARLPFASTHRPGCDRTG